MSDEREEPASRGIHTWIGIIGFFVAPTTVITSLCFYFGYVSEQKFFAFYGISADAVGLTTSDYVVNSVSVLFAPILLLLAAWLAVVWAAVYVRRFVQSGPRAPLARRIAWTVIAVGVLGIAAGAVGVDVGWSPNDYRTALTPLALGVGTAAVVVGAWMLATTTTGSTPKTLGTAARTSLVVATATILLALFWCTDIFASAYGEHRAEKTLGELWSRETGVVLDTSNPLGAPNKLIRESRLPPGGPADGLKFRYECFRTLAVRGDRWVLIPAKWTPENGYAVIVTTTSSGSGRGSQTRISLMRWKGIADTSAANWSGSWQCPEVAPPP